MRLFFLKQLTNPLFFCSSLVAGVRRRRGDTPTRASIACLGVNRHRASACPKWESRQGESSQAVMLYIGLALSEWLNTNTLSLSSSNYWYICSLSSLQRSLSINRLSYHGRKREGSNPMSSNEFSRSLNGVKEHCWCGGRTYYRDSQSQRPRGRQEIHIWLCIWHRFNPVQGKEIVDRLTAWSLPSLPCM